MKTRIFRVLLIAVLLVPLSGCPTGSTFTLGVWIVTLLPVNDVAQSRSIEFLADGMTMNPNPLPPHSNITFAPTVTWSQMGSAIVLTQILAGGSTYVFTGTVHSNTIMSGTFEQTVGGNFSGIWSAQYLP